jgi:hypothetical protein
MIQRIQSLYLLLGAAALILSYFVSFGTLPAAEAEYAVRSYGLKGADGNYLEGVSTYWFHIPLSLVIAANLWALVKFGDRRAQLNLVKGTFVLFAVSFVLLSLYIYGAGTAYPEAPMKPGVAVVLLFIALLLNWLAARAIRKDEELVRSVDRIR